MVERIIKNITKNRKNVIDQINQEIIDIYLFLKKQYGQGSVDKNYLFQFVFRSFYRLDNAGLGDDLKNKYFELMQQGEVDLKTILIELSKIENLRGRKTVQFSFATKLLHTINEDNPIYDSQVGKVINENFSGSTIEKRIESAIIVYEKLKNIQKQLLDNKDILRIIKEIRKRFKQDSPVTRE